MTYRELGSLIDGLNDYQKNMHVTFKLDDEFYGHRMRMDFADERSEDRLDGKHPYLEQTWITGKDD